MRLRSGISTPGSWLYRIAPSLFAACLFLGFAVLRQLDPVFYVAVMHHYIWTLATDMPFGDLGAVLQASACWHQGADVFQPNVCMGGGMFNYSPFLLRIGLLGLGPQALLPSGVVLSLAFIAACALLPPARTSGELVLRCALLCSCAAAHGVECGNIDLAMFVLVVIGLALQQAKFAGRLLGYAVFLLGGALKFYPAVLLALLLRENRQRVAGIVIALACGAAVVLWRDWQALSGLFANLPLGLPFRGSFGAVNLPFGLAMLGFMTRPSVLPDSTQFYMALHHPHLATYVVLGSKLLVAAGLIAGMQLAPRYTAGLQALDHGRRAFLVAGALLLAFCFYIAPNYEYRGVFLLLAVPGLYSMARAEGRSGGCCAGLMLTLMPLLLWERVLWEAGRRIGEMLPGHALAAGIGIGLWVLREYAWWFIMVRFTAIAIAYMRGALHSLLTGTGMLLPSIKPGRVEAQG
jgi:hypothetical protein